MVKCFLLQREGRDYYVPSNSSDRKSVEHNQSGQVQGSVGGTIVANSELFPNSREINSGQLAAAYYSGTLLQDPASRPHHLSSS